MPGLIESVSIAPSGAHVRLVLESFDSGEECSLQHWLEVCRLVEDADIPAPLDEAESLDETEFVDELEEAAWI